MLPEKLSSSAVSLFCWCIIFGSILAGTSDAHRQLNFDIDDYHGSLTRLREALKCEKITRSRPKEHASFFRLCNDAGLRPDDKFVELKVDVGDGNVVSFAIYAVNLYVLGFKSKDTAYLFDEAREFNLPPNFFAARTTKSIGSGHYQDLSRANDKVGKESLQLGFEPFRTSVRNLANKPDTTTTRAKSLMILIQMISEAARFGHIEYEVSSSVGYPDEKTNYLERNWQTISEAIYNANPQTGALRNPLTITYDGHRQLYSVGDIVDNLGNIKMLLKTN